MSSTGKTGGHFRPCKVGSVEAHNERRPEYIESVRKAGLNLYFFEEFTPNNSSWVSEDEKYKGKTVEEVFDCMKNVYREKIGQAPQLKEREVIDKKTGRPKKIAGWSPIREMCVPIKEDTKIEDFEYFRKWLKKHGIEVIRIDLHKDEGYHDEKTGEYKMNLHAHVIASFLDLDTGKTVKEGPDVMSQMQTVLAMSLGMVRGELKKDTDKEYLTHQQYRKMQEKLDSMEEQLQEQEKEIRNNASTIASQKQQMYFLNGQIKLAEKKLKSFQTMIKNLESQKQQLEQEISTLNEQHKTGKISYDELQRRTIDLNNQINEINSKLINKKNKYNETEQQLQTLCDQKKDIQNDLECLKDKYNEAEQQLNALSGEKKDLQDAINDLKEKKKLAEKELPEILDRAQSKTNDSFWEIAMEESKKDYTAFENFSKKLPANLKNEFNSILENSFFEDIAQRGEEMAGVAAGLFLGYVDQATSFAHSSGGGGGHPGNWGRKKDEDDEAYLRRCCIMGRMMMRPAGRKKQIKKGL